MYIKFIYDDSNYDALILYFVSLAIGRFVYFDFTAEDFISTISKLLKNLYLLILMGCYSGFVCWFGFHVGFLLTSNGVIVSTLLAHLFMDASIFVLDKNPSDPVCPLKKTDITKDTKRSPVKSMALNSLQGIYPSVSIDTISDSMSFNRSDHSGNVTGAHTAGSVCHGTVRSHR